MAIGKMNAGQKNTVLWLFDLLEKEPSNGTPSEWYAGKKAALAYCGLTERMSRKPGTNQWKELFCLDSVVEKGLFELVDDSRLNIVDLGSGNGEKAINIIRKLAEREKRARVSYFPVDFNKFMSVYALLNIYFTITDENVDRIFHLTDEDLEIFRKFDHSVDDFMEQSSKVVDVMQCTSPVAIREYFSVKPDVVARIVNIDEKMLDDTAMEVTDSLEKLISRAKSIRGDEHWREIVEHGVRNNGSPSPEDSKFAISMFDATMNLLVSDLEKQLKYVRSCESRNEKMKLFRIQNSAGAKFFRTTNELLDRFEKYAKANTYWELNAIEQLELNESFFVNPSPLAMADCLSFNCRCGVPFNVYQALKGMSRLFFVEEACANHSPISEATKDYDFRLGVLPTRGIEIDFRNTKDMMKIVEYLTSYGQGRNVVALLGQTLGNYNKAEREAFILNLGQNLQQGDLFMLGVDIRPDEKWDSEALEMRIKNMEKEYSSGRKFMQFAIDDKKAKYLAKYNPENHSMEFSFKIDSRIIPMGFSYKFSVDEVNGLLVRAGFNFVGAQAYVGKYELRGRNLNSGPEYMVVLAQKK